MKECLESMLQVMPGDLILWRIPMMRDRLGVGIVLKIEEIQDYSSWEKINYPARVITIKWQRGPIQQMNVSEHRNSLDPGKSMWRLS
jgi:hypothetical protein